jgi:hypothetical protein
MTGAYCWLNEYCEGMKKFFDPTYVGNKVDARQLLHKLTTNAEQSATTETLWILLEKSQNGCTTGCRSLFFKCMFNLLYFCGYDGVILGDRMGLPL